ncbi:MAG: hypothetical protein CM15mP71_3530 [Candidatus Poseidoniales archaeon]|nr:MAG: hypothetical protein CM15mP71_3530 [Candidatus Poseidoniales archaeon]
MLANKLLLSMTSAGLAIGLLLRKMWGSTVDLRHSSLGMVSVALMLTTAGIGGEYSRGETLLLFIPKDTVMLFPMWASIAILALGLAIFAKSAVQHRS